MTMKSEILEALKREGEPMISEDLVAQVRLQSGVDWKGSSIRKALGVLVTQGKVTNLDRDPVTGNYRRIPCRYELA